MPDIDQVLRDNLTDEQYLAAKDTTSEVLCLACAGSGKSRTLAFRIARLVAEGEDPKGIVAFTFTVKAADAIKRGVAEALITCGINPSILGAMYIGTIHSYCNFLLGEVDAKYRQFEVLDQNKFWLFLISRYGRLGLKRLKEHKGIKYFECIQNVAQAWNTLNDEMLSIDEVNRQDPILGNVLHNLMESLLGEEYFDFSLMIRLVVDKLRNNDADICNTIQYIKHLMVDEYQDINPVQEELIRGIHSRVGDLFVVGDDDQAIYAWRGADVNNILEFETRYPDCASYPVTCNFRSVPPIVSCSSDFVARQLGPSRIPKTPNYDAKNENRPRQVANLWFPSRQAEGEWVAQRIEHLLGKSFEENDPNIGTRGLCKSDFAILMASTNKTEQDGSYHHSAYTEALDTIGIRHMIEAQGSIFNSDLATTLRSTFELLRNPVIDRPTLTQHFNNEVLTTFPNANFAKLAAVITRWQRLIHQPVSVGRRKIAPQQLLYELFDAFNVKDTQFDDVEMRILGTFSKIMEDVEAVYFSIDSTERFRDVLNYLNVLAEESYDLVSDEVLQRPDAVFVSTIHKAKGLEFPVVFLVDVEQNRMPGRNRTYNGWIPTALLANAISRGRYCNDLNGDARLFYTAITRAERYLYISGSEVLPGARSTRQRSIFSQSLHHAEITNNPNDLPQGISSVPPDRVVQRIDETIMPTSYSEIKYYLTCPKNYQFRKQYGFKMPVPDLYGFGQTTHASISKLHQVFTSAIPSQDEAETITRETFNLKHVPRSNDPRNSPGPFENALNKAVEVVKNYVNDYGRDYSNERRVEVRFEIPAEKAIINGSIDLLIREDDSGNIIESKVIDFKTLNEPEEEEKLDWTDLSIQVQLYAKAANEVLGENAKTGAVHLLRDNLRVDVPISDEAIDAAVKNIEWAVDGIINNEYPMRPHPNKCDECDFKLICSKQPERFKETDEPPAIYLPSHVSSIPLKVKAFSEFHG